jgi:hypothetical protein
MSGGITQHSETAAGPNHGLSFFPDQRVRRIHRLERILRVALATPYRSSLAMYGGSAPQWA